MTGRRSLPAEDDDAGSYALDPEHVLSRLVAGRADSSPERLFLVEVSGRALTYAQTWSGVKRWVTELRRLGLGPGDRFVTMLPPSVDAVLVWLAAGCLGALEIPVDPAFRGTFLTHVLADAGAQLCLVRPQHTALLDPFGLRVVALPADTEPVPPGLPCDDVRHPSPTDPSCVIYTSGTTGLPKGVVISWAQMSASVGRIPRSWLSREDAAYDCHPMFHVTGRTPLLSMADAGGRVVLRDGFSVASFWEDVRRHGCTTTTAHAALLLTREEEPDDADNPLRLVFGGHDRRASARFAERFDVHTIDAYGSTEAGFPLVERWPDHTRSRCGRIRRGYEVQVVDEAGAEVPDGTVGELWVRPPSRELMLLEYLNDPELTAAATAGGRFRTGDAFIRHEDGTFEFIDRLRDTIRRHGENISATAIEQVVANDPAVLECAVLGVPDAVAGQSVVLVAVPSGEDLDPAALLERLRGELPRHALPSYVVVLEELPHTATNKVRRSELRDSLDLTEAWCRSGH